MAGRALVSSQFSDAVYTQLANFQQNFCDDDHYNCKYVIFFSRHRRKKNSRTFLRSIIRFGARTKNDFSIELLSLH